MAGISMAIFLIFLVFITSTLNYRTCFLHGEQFTFFQPLTILVLKNCQFATLKKIGPKIWGAKNGVRIFFCYSKREAAVWPLLFLIAIASRKNMVQTLKKNRVDIVLRVPDP